MPQDYSGQNLRGRSFRGQNLEGANFSGADIRSADFSGAILVGANFSHAKAGLQRRWATFLVVVSWVLAGISGFLSAFAGVFVAFLAFSKDKNFEIAHQIAGWTVVIVLIIFFFVTFRQGIQAGLGALAVALVLSFFGTFAGAITGVIPRALGGLLAGTATFAGALAGVLALTIAIAIAVAVAGAIAVAGALSVIVVLLSTYISWRALNEDPKHALIRNIAIAFAAIGGTSYRKANLTDANFTEAILKSTNFREATLTRTYWWNARKLNLALPGTTYLNNLLVRQLVVTGDGKKQNFDRLDLRGLNLRDANLENASFIDTDLYQADLSNADLSRTVLVRTNLERADLRDACLTGSCIQDWIISRGTKLDGIVCDYVYLKWDDVKKDKRDQMPPRGKFKEGGFVTFVKYILDTVELYHEKDINPRLVLTVLQKMAKDYEEPFDIVALGKRDEKVFIQVKVSENIIRENFKDDYYSRYDTNLKLWSGNIHQLPPAVNSFIENRISEIVSERTDDFVFVDANYVEGNYAEIYQGEVNMSGDRNIKMGSGNYNESIQGNYVQGNYYAAGQQSLADAAAEIQKLLEQLDKSYPTNTTAGKMAIATQAIQYIDNDKTLAQRVLSALKAGGTQALAQLINHPAASFVIGALDDWLKSQGS